MLRLLIFAGVALLVIRMISRASSAGQIPSSSGKAESGGSRSAHELLGVEPGASREEIRRAYQEKIHQYHPDKVANLADELRELAERRTKEINAAYQQLTGK